MARILPIRAPFVNGGLRCGDVLDDPTPEDVGVERLAATAEEQRRLIGSNRGRSHLPQAAVVERFIKSLKHECLRAILVPLRRKDLQHEIDLYLTWYHRHRPHQGLGGIVPLERDHVVSTPAPKESMRTPRAAARDMPLVIMEVTFLEGRRHLPIVELRKAA